MYKLNETGITRTINGAWIPPDPSNTDYAEYLDWVAAGNTPQPADPSSVASQNAPICVQITEAELKTLRAIREHLLGDTAAIDRLKAINDDIAVLRSTLTK